VQDVKLGWDAKRDRWNGYDAAEYLNVVKDFEELEKMKKDARGEVGQVSAAPTTTEEARYAEESDMGRQQSTATRNLRLREDTAKYLLNLDLDSAKYDPKSRMMVDAGASTDVAAALVAEENFMRSSGDAGEFEKAQKFAWESQERGDSNKIHLQANPTSGEYVRKKQLEEATKKKEAEKSYLLEMYGGGESQKPNPRKGAVVENERFVEYDETGAVKGLPQKEEKSKYAEDVYIHNHTSVWGSWWKDFQWGYACCHSTVKNSYCTGEAGKDAFRKAEQMGLEEEAEEAEKDEVEEGVGKQAPASKANDMHSKKDAASSRKRTVEELKAGITEEELEAYKRSKTKADDPLLKFASTANDELVR
jgi:pre-mRNA-processing factor SLU7